MSEENNYTIWSFLKKCHDRDLIYRGYDAMPWCPRCSVGLSQMEMAEGYQLVTHRAVFVRFPLRGRPGDVDAGLAMVPAAAVWNASSKAARLVSTARPLRRMAPSYASFLKGSTPLPAIAPSSTALIMLWRFAAMSAMSNRTNRCA